jgi:hypothetical protein
MAVSKVKSTALLTVIDDVPVAQEGCRSCHVIVMSKLQGAFELRSEIVSGMETPKLES